jgi:hypothetical protein
MVTPMLEGVTRGVTKGVTIFFLYIIIGGRKVLERCDFFAKIFGFLEKISYLCKSLSWEYGFEWRTNFNSVRDTTYLPVKLKIIV